MSENDERQEVLFVLQSFGAGVVIPLAQAVVAGVFIAGAVLCVAILVGLAGIAVLVWLSFFVMAFFVWCLLLANWLKINNQAVGAYDRPAQVEYIDSQAHDVVDVDQPAQLEPAYVRIQLHQDNRIQFFDLPASGDQLRALAVGVSRGMSLSESCWTGSGRPFSRSQFAALRAELLRRGLAFWISEGSPSQGWRLNNAGIHVLKAFATTNLPDQDQQ